MTNITELERAGIHTLGISAHPDIDMALFCFFYNIFFLEQLTVQICGTDVDHSLPPMVKLSNTFLFHVTFQNHPQDSQEKFFLELRLPARVRSGWCSRENETEGGMTTE
jgi:hypothetical protein